MRTLVEEQNLRVVNGEVDVWSIVRDIARTEAEEDAFYVCDLGNIVEKYGIWRKKLPRVQPFYAVKCNDSLMVLQVLATLGTGFDCASKTEINKILSLNVGADRIIFANPAKPNSHIRHAAAMGVDTMTFDSEIELHKVKQLFPQAKMVIRIRCDAKIAQCQLGMKFGCNPITEAPNLLILAKALGVEVVGVSFHVGSGCGEIEVFNRAISTARKIFDFATSLGFDFNLLDIGGGFPGDRGTSIDKLAEVINTSLETNFPDSKVKIIAEPGRFFVSSAYTLTCSIHSIRVIPTKSDISTKHYMYYINDGVYGSFNCILYDHQHVKAQPLKEYTNAKLYSSSVWGPTCDGLDNVLEDVLLPELQLGDWMVFENMGAYTLPVASPFNGFPVPKVHFVASKSVWMMLKDLLAEDEIINGKARELETSELRKLSLRCRDVVKVIN